MKVIAVILGAHTIRWACEELYHMYCSGFITSIFAHSSPTCNGLRWVSTSVSTNLLGIIGALAGKGMALLFSK